MAKAPIEQRAIDRTVPAEEGIAKPAAGGVYTKPRAQFALTENSKFRKDGSKPNG